MNTDKATKILSVFGILIGLLVVLALGWSASNAEKRAARSEDLMRQLEGRLTDAEKAFQQANLKLGFVQSQLASQEEVERRYLDLIEEKDEEMAKLTRAVEEFRKAHKAHVDSLLQATLHLRDEIKEGRGTAVVTPSDRPEEPPTISYEYRDAYNRVHLTDPDIMKPGNETLTLDQQFRLTAVVLRQNEGNLKAQQVALQEVVREGESWKAINTAQLVDADFTYAPDPQKPVSWFDPHLIFTVGTTFRSEAPVNIGVGATLIRYQDFGLAVNLYSDMQSLAGSGLGAQATWRPRVGDRPLNVGLAAGAGVGADLSVRPYVGTFFVLY